MERQFFAYILAGGKHGTVHIGVTSDLLRRMSGHKLKLVPGFSARYGVDKLVYSRFLMTLPMPSRARSS